MAEISTYWHLELTETEHRQTEHRAQKESSTERAAPLKTWADRGYGF